MYNKEVDYPIICIAMTSFETGKGGQQEKSNELSGVFVEDVQEIIRNEKENSDSGVHLTADGMHFDVTELEPEDEEMYYRIVGNEIEPGKEFREYKQRIQMNGNESRRAWVGFLSNLFFH